MSKGLYLIQQGLADMGYDPGPTDGLWGPRTRAAVNAMAAADGAPRQAVQAAPVAPAATVRPSDRELPWMAIARQHLGLHEGRDNAALRRFLSSDGHALGDPAQLPWCGDFVETCIRIGLPKEPIPDLPYWARSWEDFAKPTLATFGAVVVFERGPTSGHVAFLVGRDQDNWYCLGGNQSDGVTIARIGRARTLAIRWPTTWVPPALHLAAMAPGQTTLSTNEA